MEKIIKQILIISLLLLLLLPLIQIKFNLINEKPLNGAIVEIEKSHLKLKDWFNGKYQHETETYLNENFGFRKTFIRINNQIRFNLFKKTNAKDVIIGNNNYLYEINYIKSYLGIDFLGYDIIKERVKKIKTIQDSLKSMGKEFIVIFAPSKVKFFPEYIPEKYIVEKNISNYEIFAQEFLNNNINHIDFNKYFFENKNKSQYPLFPQYGIHWSDYGSCLAADSIIKYIEKLKDIDMPNFNIIGYEIDKPRSRDNDIADGLNIFSKLKTYDMAYAIVEHESDSNKIKPSSTVISDSFYWGMFEFHFITQAFSKNSFWYYNSEVFVANEGTKRYRVDLNLKKEIENTDIFILIGTEPSLKKLGWGIIDQMYDLLTNVPTILSAEYNFREKSIRDKMNYYTDWKAAIEKNAIQNNISVDSMMNLEIIWMLENGN